MEQPVASEPSAPIPLTTMSNTNTPSQKSGSSQRRRSSSGKSRNSRSRSQRSEEYRPTGPRPPRHAPVVTLTFWQKLLKAIGLYKEAPPAPAKTSPSHGSVTAKPASSARTSAAPAKSNTRNARTHETSEPKPKRSSRGDSKSRGGDPSTVESARVYVGNLSYDVAEQDLQELFKGVGPVRGVEIVYNRATHRSKGYGFVEMLHKDDAVRSVEVLHDQPFMGRNMVVSGAKSRGADDREDQDEQAARPERAVVVAPVPAAAVASAAALPVFPEEEPQIATIVESVHSETKPNEA